MLIQIMKKFFNYLKVNLNLEAIHPSQDNFYFRRHTTTKLCVSCNHVITPTLDGYCPFCTSGAIMDIPLKAKQQLLENLS